MRRKHANGKGWEDTVRGRIRFLGLLMPMLLLLPAGKAFYLQIYERDSLRQRANQQSRMVEKVQPHRGAIFDRNGQPLAIGVPVPSIYAVREEVKDKRSAARRLSKVLGMSTDTLYDRLERGSGFVWLRRMVEPQVAEGVSALALEGVGIRTESRRYYPNSDLAGSVLGFVGTDRGLEGLECSLEEHLKGGDGVRVLNLDAMGKALTSPRPWERPPAVGSTVHLTLDRNVQFFAEQSLREGCRASGAAAGVAIIMEPATGRILAMASYPGFNPNDFGSFDQENYRNRAISSIYEPGSTFKVVTIAAALEEKVFDEMDILFCNNGRFEVADVVINDHLPHGWLTLMGIIRKSSNIGASKVGLEVGRERLGKYVRAFGFGQRTGILLPGEGRGILRDESSWTQVDLANISFGQGLGVTPLQMVTAINAVATGGDLLKPYIVDRITSPTGEVILQNRPGILRRVVSGDTARKVARMMETVTEPGGSGMNASISGYKVAGKTGTAQKFDLSEGTYSSDAFIASFAGFAPSQNPAVTAIVIIDQPTETIYGGAVAAPVWRDMVSKTLKYLNVTPEMDQDAPHPAKEPGVLAQKEDPVAAPDLKSMPDLRGLTLREALARLAFTGASVKVTGTGVVVGQSPEPGRSVGERVSLNLKPRTSG
ncbi:MAG: PASTA domain-containing protein [bacterium]|nr:MAG: PASTA domain-containing protein [bacterium]